MILEQSDSFWLKDVKHDSLAVSKIYVCNEHVLCDPKSINIFLIQFLSTVFYIIFPQLISTPESDSNEIPFLGIL